MTAAAIEQPRVERGPGRPEGGYRLADGTRALSVTDICERMVPAEALLHWHRRQALEALQAGASPRAAAWAGHFRAKDLADHGTRIHEAIVDEVCGGYDGGDLDCLLAIRAFRAWQADTGPKGGAGLRIIRAEWPLVSDAMRLGGTYDLLAVDDVGRPWVVDVKTGSRLRGTHLLQCGMYSMLVDEHCERTEREDLGTHGIVALHIPREAPGTWDADVREGAQLKRIRKAGRWAISLAAALDGMDAQLEPKKRRASHG